MARLVVISSPLAGSIHELGESWTTIGRADTNAFQLVAESVSGRHCEVRAQGEELRVRDLLSTNGTFINGKKITEGTVKPGEVVRVGDVELRYESSAPGTLSGAPFSSKMLVSSLGKPAESAPAAAQKTAAASEPAAAPGKQFHVLFVDDSMAFLESFGGLCAEWSQQAWRVHTAVSADRALALLQQFPMDLVVLDVAMPMLDGLQLLGLVKRRQPNVKVVVLTGVATESRRAAALAGGAELFLEKPVATEAMRPIFNVLNDLISWRPEGFTGALRQVELAEVVQMECNNRRSAILEVRNPECCGQIFIEAGSLIHAIAGELTGEPAVYRLLSLSGGEFDVKPYAPPPRRTIESQWENLLLEAARVLDEETALFYTPKTPSPLAPPAVDHGLGDEIVVVGTYDGDWRPETAPLKPAENAAETDADRK